MEGVGGGGGRERESGWGSRKIMQSEKAKDLTRRPRAGEIWMFTVTNRDLRQVYVISLTSRFLGCKTKDLTLSQECWEDERKCERGPAPVPGA